MIMNKEYICAACLVTVAVISLSFVPGVAQNSSQHSSYNFTFHNIVVTNNVIADLFLDNVTWNEADVICKITYGYLAFENKFDLIKKLKSRGVDLVWVGIHRRANVLVANSSKLYVHNKGKYYKNEWGWSTDERGFDNDCVVLNVTERSFITRDCESRLPFVCVNNRAISQDIACPENFVFLLPLSTSGRKCTSNLNEPSLRKDAEERCHGFNGSRIATDDEYDILHLNNFIVANNDTEFWVQKKNSNPCPIKIISGTSNPSEDDCSKHLPFICVKSLELENVDIEVKAEQYKNSNPHTYHFLPTYSNIKKIFTCHVKGAGNRHPSYRWYKEDLPVECDNESCDFSKIQSPFEHISMNRTRRNEQGSYHCEVRFDGLSKTYSSQKVDLFFADIATYVIDIGGIRLDSYYDYSHHGFLYSREKVTAPLSDLLKKLDFNITALEVGTQQRVSFRENVATIQALLFIARTTDFDDEKIYIEVKTLLENSAVTSEIGTLSFTVKSGDVCFKKDANSNDSCQIKWPTSNPATNVISEFACLDETKKFVNRECKPSTVNEAKWSDFNCSVCTNFIKRYQDSALLCPNNFTKVSEQNLCIRIYHEKKNWYDAYKTCAKLSSYMLSELHGEFIDGLDSLWLSYKYSNGKIQGYGKKPINIAILANITSSHHGLHCVSAILEGQKYKLENCSKEFSFVCVRDLYEFVSCVKSDVIWTKPNAYQDISTCYHLSTNVTKWEKSANKCKEVNEAAVLFEIQDINRYQDLKRLILHKYPEPSNKYGCPQSWWVNFTDVIQNGMTKTKYVDWNPYVNFNLKEQEGAVTFFQDRKIYWDLADIGSELSPICEIQNCEDNRPITSYIEHHEFHGQLKLKCAPIGWFIDKSINFYHDDFPVSISSDPIFFLTSSKQELFLEAQGYYTCSVDENNSMRTVHSSKYLFRQPGFHTFAISMVSQNKMYLKECFKYAFSNNEYGETSVKKCFDDNKFVKTVKSFHFLLKNLTCNSTHVSMTVHVHFEKETGEEQKIFKTVQDINLKEFCEACDIEINSISQRSTAACYREITYLKDANLTWPDTPLGETQYSEESCLTDENIRVQRRCMGDFNFGAFWSDVSITECRNLTQGLYNLLHNYVADNVSVPQLLSLTSTPVVFQPLDVKLTVEIIGTLGNDSIPSGKLKDVVEIFSNLIDIPSKVLIEAENSSNRIIEEFERLVSVTGINSESENVTTQNILVSVYSFNSSAKNIPNCILFSNSTITPMINSSEEDSQKHLSNFKAGILLPDNFNCLSENESCRMVYAMSQNIKHFEDIEVIVSVVVKNASNYIHSLETEEQNVTLFFNLNKRIEESDEVQCVYWDIKTYKWSYDGCFLKEKSGDIATCVCNHLSSFAVILHKGSSFSSTHKAILRYITFIGFSLSCFGLGIILLTFLRFREWRKGNKSLFCYSLSEFIFFVTFMAGIDKTSSVVWCKATAITLHYFLLSSFAWMVVLAVAVYLKLVKVWDAKIPCFMQKAMIFAWGVPAIIVITFLSCDHNYYYGKEFCWLSSKSQHIFYYGIASPLISMLVVNYIIFAVTFYAITCGKNRSPRGSNQDRRKFLISRAKSLFCISVLLGLSWIFGILAIDKLELVFIYLFCITTTIQGFLLGMFFVLLPKRTRQLWAKFLLPENAFKLVRSNTSSIAFVRQEQKNVEPKKKNEYYSVLYKRRTPNS